MKVWLNHYVCTPLKRDVLHDTHIKCTIMIMFWICNSLLRHIQNLKYFIMFKAFLRVLLQAFWHKKIVISPWSFADWCRFFKKEIVTLHNDISSCKEYVYHIIIISLQTNGVLFGWSLDRFDIKKCNIGCCLK